MTFKSMIINILQRQGTALLAFACLTMAVVPNALAQSDSGRIVGTVTDTTGAAIPQASISLLNKATGAKLVGTSNASGELNVSAVPAGDYIATVAAPGFQTQTQSLTVVVTTSLTLNFALRPGEQTTTVEVTGAASLVNTSDPTLGETIEEKQITELPLNGLNSPKSRAIDTWRYPRRLCRAEPRRGRPPREYRRKRHFSERIATPGQQLHSGRRGQQRQSPERDSLLSAGFRHAGVQGGHQRGPRAIRPRRRSPGDQLH